MTTELLKQALSAMRDVADLMADRWPMDTQQRAPKFFQAMRDIDTALAQPADEDAWLEKAVDIAQEFYDRAFRADTEIQLRAHLRTRPAREGFVSVNEQTIRAPAAFKAKDDRIAKLERELAESKAREEQLRLDAARWALFRDTPSGTFDQYKDEWRFRCNVIGGMWCKSKDDAMDYALSKLQPSGHITQKGDTNADV